MSKCTLCSLSCHKHNCTGLRIFGLKVLECHPKYNDLIDRKTEGESKPLKKAVKRYKHHNTKVRKKC